MDKQIHSGDGILSSSCCRFANELLSLLYLDPSCCDTDAQRHHAGLIAQ